MKVAIRGLENYGISESQLYRLGGRTVVVEIHFDYPRFYSPGKTLYRKLLRKSPASRQELLYEWFDKKLAKLEKQFAWTNQELNPFVRITAKDYPAILYWGVQVSVPAKDLEKLNTLPEVESLWIKRISGKPRRKRRGPREPLWYAVRGRLAWAVEGQAKGLQTYEDRTIVLKAKSENEARRLAVREFRNYERLTLLETGFFHRTRFETILDVCELMDEEISPEGTEVFSILQKRRMKPEFVWDPKEEMSAKRKGRRD